MERSGRSRRVRVLGGALAAGLIVASCGGDDGAAAEPDPLVDARTTEQVIADFNLADASLLTLADFPAGWKVEIPESNPETDRQLMACAGIEDTTIVLNEAAEDTEQLALDNAKVISEVNVYPTPEFADAALAPVLLPVLPGCYEELLEAELGYVVPKGTTVTANVTITPADLGDDAATLHAELLVAIEGIEQRSILDMTVVRIGRSVMSLTVSNLGVPFDAALRQQLLNLSLLRLAEI